MFQKMRARGGIFLRKMSMLLFVVFLLVHVSLFARDVEHTPFEIFSGYSFVRSVDGGIQGAACPTIIVPCIFRFGGDQGKNMSGWNMAFTGNLNSTYGVKAEVSGFYPKLDESWDDFKASGYSLMAGPQINKRSEEYARLFVHALFGLKKYTVGSSWDSESFYSFTMAFGGGIDWEMGNWAIRAPQVDYIPWKNSQGYLNNFRLSTGIVFKFIPRK